MGEFNEDVGIAAALEDGVNWEATSHQQIYDWFAQAPPESMRASVETWNDKIAAHVQAAADAVNGALRVSGVHWEGQAAEAMRSSSGPLAEHALVSQVAALFAGGSTSQQVTEASRLAATIPEPQPARTQQELLDANGGDFVNYLDDVYEQEVAAREAESRARKLAASYDASTDVAVSTLPQFNPAVSVTAGMAPPGQSGPGAVEHGGPGPGGESGGPGPGADGGDGGRPASQAPPAPASPDTPGGTPGQSWTPPQSVAQTPPPVPPPVPVGQDGARPPGPMPGLVAGPAGRQAGLGGRPAGGRLGGATGHPGPGGGAAGQPGSGARGGGAAGPGAGARGGPGALDGPRGGSPAVPGRAAGAAGMMPMGAATRGQGDDHTERNSPEYLRDHHDEFWDDTPPVAPPVIGEDDDE